MTFPFELSQDVNTTAVNPIHRAPCYLFRYSARVICLKECDFHLYVVTKGENLVHCVFQNVCERLGGNYPETDQGKVTELLLQNRVRLDPINFTFTITVLGYELDDRGIRVPAGAGNFSLHHHSQIGSGAHPASYPVGTRGSFPGCEADHSPPSNAEVKNAWGYTSTPPVHLHGLVLS
jgi:hypothetical protein